MIPDDLKLSKIEVEILFRLNSGTFTGEELYKNLDIKQVRFDKAIKILWQGCFLKGRLEDGCCGAPCGQDCVSAFKNERSWLLTKKGMAALQKQQI
ncbi:MAG: hypothetical protein ABJG88_12880 [Litorimonas sp.]